MQLTINNDVLSTLVICTTTLGFKMIVTNMWRLFPSILSGNGVPEDSWLWKLLGLFPGDQTHGVSNNSSKADNDDNDKEAKARALARADRVIGNDLENIPIGIVLMWVAAVVLGDNDDNSNKSDGLATWAIIFTASRVVHSFTYLLGITVVRSVAFVPGCVSIIRFGWYALANIKSI